ncbi:hypothetical protein PPL_09362 [Heterostelium album PN500]|uniref:Uncharacterized protein n=1 Tax=Heterostelium pallidum (strain ATCC 26659 / Pp 5 / PN500) TaxID=670386 RepID=D3BLC8_HETP5|nr:hypothetical protein PPL_09362 [Heterostelium album PN500]EFA77862.1 hypothetical protein PPL_09362 [Heterostelium album PN500]|eukprot:XP_020429990.1 hypothetical protein PPL_09362 [Heterostelium album PN500]
MSIPRDSNIVTLAVIGTAGRDPNKQLTKDHFKYMCDTFDEFIESHHLLEGDKQLVVVSGGSAWADHVVVDRFLNDPNRFKLILYLPCPIVDTEIDDDDDDVCYKRRYQYLDTGSIDWYKNPGRISNMYHDQFESIMCVDPIGQIIQAKEKGAILDTSSNGFHNRNTKISKSDLIVAFTFGEDQPEIGTGTHETWKQSLSKKKYHYSLSKITTRS